MTNCAQRSLRNQVNPMDDRTCCYPGSSTLVNKLGIRDRGRLETAERRLTMLRIMELMDEPVWGGFDLDHLCRIHGYIFQDLYEWAGELRRVDIAKGTLFCRVEFLRQEAERIFGGIAAGMADDGPGCREFACRLAYHFSEINALHPFRDGNGRAQREFIREFALACGYEVSFAGVTEGEMLEASRASFLCDYKPMEKLFQKCVKERGRKPVL